MRISRRVEAAAGLAPERALGDQRRSRARAPRRRSCAPIAAETSRPTRSSSASGPIGCPAPRRMQWSIASGVQPGLLEQPHGVEEVGEEQAVDDEARHVGHLDRGLAERLAQRARARARVACVASGGKASSTSSIFGTGLKTCSADEALGRAARVRPARRPTARRWWWPAPRGVQAPGELGVQSSALAAASSAIASTTKVASAEHARSVSMRTLAPLRPGAEASRRSSGPRARARSAPSRPSAPTPLPRRARRRPPPARRRWRRRPRCPAFRAPEDFATPLVDSPVNSYDRLATEASILLRRSNAVP